MSNEDVIEKMNKTLEIVEAQQTEIMDGNDIEELLDAQHLEVIEHEKTITPAKDLETDYEKSREIYQNLAVQGQNALSDMLNMAKVCDSPRAYEVVGQLIKTTAEVTGELIKLQRDVRRIATDEAIQNAGGPGPNTVTNNLFVGSTNELLKKLKEMEKGK